MTPPATRAPEGAADDTSRRRRWVVAVAVLLLGLALAVTAAALGARRDLGTAERALEEAQVAVRQRKVAEARSALERGASAAGSAVDRLSRPDVRLVAAVPILGANLRSATAVAVAVDEVVASARPVVDQLGTLLDDGVEGEGLPLDELAAAAPPLSDLAAAVGSALDRVQGSTDRWLLREVADARAELIEELGRLEHDVAVAADLAEALPVFLGADGPRRYFLGTANPAELRGSTGYVGSFAIAELSDGDLEVGPFRPLWQLSDAEPGFESALADRWDQLGGAKSWKVVHATPDVPTAARGMLDLYEHTEGERLDGVILVDPFALEVLLRVTGPVVDESGARLSANHAVQYLTHDAYADFGPGEERQEILGGVAATVLDRFLGDAGAALDKLDQLSRVTRERHLVLYATDPRVRDAFAAAGLDGALPDAAAPDGTGDLVVVVANSGSNSKVDYYLDRELDYRVDLGADGLATGYLDVRFRNGAPDEGEVGYVIGPNMPGLEAGDSLLHVSTYCATGCEIVGAEGGIDGELDLEEELGHDVAAGWVKMPSGGSDELRYKWRNPAAWVEEDGRVVYRLRLRTQVAIRPPSVRAAVAIPDGFTVEEVSEGAVVTSGHVELTTQQRGDVVLEVVLRPPPDE